MKEVTPGVGIKRSSEHVLASRIYLVRAILIAAIIVFIVDFIGSMLVFSRRPVLNALASAILFAVIFGVLVYYGCGRVEMSVSTTPQPSAPAQSPPTTPAPSSH
jgi:hypothetical protein